MKTIEKLKTSGQQAIINTWTKLPSFYYPYRIRGGRIYLDITESAMMLQRVLGRYEPIKFQAIQHFLKPGDIFIDVGVNKGDFTLFGAQLVKDAGLVIAVEPEPTNCYWVRRSITHNGYKNVSVIEMALSDSTGTISLYRSTTSGHHSVISGLPERDKDVIIVNAMRLDDLIEERNVCGKITLIKIDVEGAEMKVLRGAKKTLQATPQPVLLLDLHPHLGVATEDICSFLEDLGYALYQETPSFDVPVTDRNVLENLIARPIRL